MNLGGTARRQTLPSGAKDRKMVESHERPSNEILCKWMRGPEVGGIVRG